MVVVGAAIGALVSVALVPMVVRWSERRAWRRWIRRVVEAWPSEPRAVLPSSWAERVRTNTVYLVDPPRIEQEGA